MSAGTEKTATGLIFLGAPSVPEQVELAVRAEERGFESVWVAETRITRDAIVPMAAIAAATRRIRIGSGILNVYTRHPVTLAISFVGLNELAPGRIVMGLGPGSPLILEPQGIPFDLPLTRLREYSEVIPRLLRGEVVTYSGKTVTLRGAQLDDVLTNSSASVPPGDLALWLGVTGPKAIELAGELADGLLMNTCLPTDYVRDRQRLIASGAERTARTASDVALGVVLCVSPHAESGEGKDRARRFVALYLSLFPNLARETGIDPELVERIRTAFDSGGIDASARFVHDGIVDHLTAAGTVGECLERIAEYRDAGALPVLFPVPGAMDLAIDFLAS